EEPLRGRLLLARKRLEQDRLRLGEEAAAHEPLEHAGGDEHGQGRRQAAQDRGGGEAHQREQEVLLLAEAHAEPRAAGQDDDFRPRVAPPPPRPRVGRRPRLGRHVGERDVHDAGVDDLEERAQGHRRGHEPLVDARLGSEGGDRRRHDRVSTVTSTLMPGRRTMPGGRSRRRTRTGSRCTTLVKFPLALSGGSSVKREPVAPEKLSTSPRSSTPGNASASTRTFCPGRMRAIWVSLKFAVTQRPGGTSCTIVWPVATDWPTAIVRLDTTPSAG